MPAIELERLGYALVIFPGGAARAMAATAQRYYTSLIASGSNAEMADAMFDFDGLNQIIGTAELLSLGKKYDPEAN
jgi:2-methylisocitrate lyase-like PEP mutase family enzyme